jgi:hypothetical protein
MAAYALTDLTGNPTPGSSAEAQRASRVMPEAKFVPQAKILSLKLLRK